MPKENVMMDLLKERATPENPDIVPSIGEEQKTQEENLAKDDLSLVKKALSFLHDVKAENSELNGIISSLMAFYKTQNKNATEETGMKIENKPSFPVSEPVDGNTGLGFDKNLIQG